MKQETLTDKEHRIHTETVDTLNQMYQSRSMTLIQIKVDELISRHVYPGTYGVPAPEWMRNSLKAILNADSLDESYVEILTLLTFYQMYQRLSVNHQQNVYSKIKSLIQDAST